MADASAPTVDRAAEPEQPPPISSAPITGDAPAKAPGEPPASKPTEDKPEAGVAEAPAAVVQEPAKPDLPAESAPVEQVAAVNGDRGKTDTPEHPPVMTGALPQLPKLDDTPKPGGGDKAAPANEHAKDDFVLDVVKETPPPTTDAPVEKPTEQAEAKAAPEVNTASEEAPLAPASTPAVTNGASEPKDIEMKDAPPPPPDSVSAPAPVAGEKRKAETSVADTTPVAAPAANGDAAPAAEEPAAKKAKADPPAEVVAAEVTTADTSVNEAMPPPSTQPPAPVGAKTNGGLKRGNSRAKKEKKPPAPVGRTERRTRSQGNIDG